MVGRGGQLVGRGGQLGTVRVCLLVLDVDVDGFSGGTGTTGTVRVCLLVVVDDLSGGTGTTGTVRVCLLVLVVGWSLGGVGTPPGTVRIGVGSGHGGATGLAAGSHSL